MLGSFGNFIVVLISFGFIVAFNVGFWFQYSFVYEAFILALDVNIKPHSASLYGGCMMNIVYNTKEYL